MSMDSLCTAIAVFFDDVENRYKKLPKGVRFSLHYGLMPIWLPAALVLCIIALILVYPITGAMKLWEDFK